MNDAHHEAATIAVVMRRFSQQRYPRIIALQQRLKGGECLSDQDIVLLQQVISDCCYLIPVIRKHPRYQPLAAKAMTLYTGIIKQALVNEGC